MPGTFHAMTRFASHEVEALCKATTLRYKIKGLDIRLAPKSLSLARLLLITPRACGNAPQRNRIRRRVKSIFYEEKLFNQPFDWIIIVRKEAINLDFSALKEILTAVLNASL